MFESYKTFKTEVAGRALVVETGKIAQLANGSCFVTYGDTQVLCTATMSEKPRDGIDFFPCRLTLRRDSTPLVKFPEASSREREDPQKRRFLLPV